VVSGSLDLAAARAALAPVSASLLATAHADAEQQVAAAEAEGRAAIDEAERRARELVDKARQEGDADAIAALAADRARGRRRARGVVLQAQAAAYAAIVDDARRAAADLVDDEAWPLMRERIRAHARSTLGPQADLVDIEGGVRGTAGGHSVSVTLDELAEARVAALADDITEAWRP
jgi:vacuolar-type H+-ATPase subunit H